jgi:hypothetical protein
MTGETVGGTGYTSPQSVTYGFDAVGNRTNRTSGIPGITSQTPTYTANDWLTSDGYDPAAQFFFCKMFEHLN